MRDLNRGKLCTLQTLLEGNSQIDPADAAQVLGDVLTDEEFDDGGIDGWDDGGIDGWDDDDLDNDDNDNHDGEDK